MPNEPKRHLFLKAVAAQFPDAPPIVDADDEVSTLTWVKGEREAGVGANEEGAWVFLGTANRDTKIFEDAIAVLKAIFADEVVEVIGYQRGAAVYCDLANANAPAEG